MTQEHKDLLIKDLCARLPYGVVIEHCSGIRGTLHDLFVHWFYDENDTMHNREASTSTFFGDADCDISKFKPYLFPLSSMTEEKRKEFDTTLKYLPAEEIDIWTLNTYDWCDKNHFDYRGLIKKGLAIDATNLNIY